MEILPVNDLDVALHNFVSKDDKMAFYACVQYNLQETRVSMPYYIPILK
jgi:double-strand break repair protein MRE11